MKLTKIISAFALFGVLASGSNVFADGGMMTKSCNKKHKVVECAPKPACEQPCYDAAPMPMKKCGLGSGMTFGIGASAGWPNENSDFVVASIPTTATFATGGTTLANATEAITFAQKHDSLYGVYANIGYMMDNGLEGNVEVGYNQLKFKDKNLSSNSMESNIVSGMLNVAYYIDLFDGMFLPYVTVGAGIGRIETKGTLYDKANQEEANVITFKDLTKTTFGYQAGAGISTSFDNVILGVGYQFKGFSSFSDSNSDLNVTVKDAAGTTGGTLNPSSQFNFGSLKINTHNITAFVKFAF